MTKAKQNEEQERKEVLRLWWEYLKRSDLYKEFCDLALKNNRKGVSFSQIKWPKKFQVKLHNKYRLNSNFLVYHVELMRVHSISFEKWWEYRKLKELEADSRMEIYDFEEDINSFIETFREFNGREPTLQEFKDKFIFQKKGFNIVLYLKIDLTSPLTTIELIKEIGEIVKMQRKTSYIHELRSINFETFSSTKIKENYIRKEELWRYLDIYDYKKQGLTMSDIIEKMGKDSKDTNIRSIFHQDLTRAKKIIKNVESFKFPGDYQPKDKN
ncbi:MAG: hypothetical protein ACYSTS_06605 [Planctomycetota bacterium]|jgi:hypothetical protein